MAKEAMNRGMEVWLLYTLLRARPQGNFLQFYTFFSHGAERIVHAILV
jgi:hypothetical protein